MVVAQRLVRILCPKCKTKIPLDQTIKEKLKTVSKYITKEIGAKIDSNYQAKGCHFCNNTGFRGRTGIFELIVIDEEIKNLIVSKLCHCIYFVSILNLVCFVILLKMERLHAYLVRSFY